MQLCQYFALKNKCFFLLLLVPLLSPFLISSCSYILLNNFLHVPSLSCFPLKNLVPFFLLFLLSLLHSVLFLIAPFPSNINTFFVLPAPAPLPSLPCVSPGSCLHILIHTTRSGPSYCFTVLHINCTFIGVRIRYRPDA